MIKILAVGVAIVDANVGGLPFGKCFIISYASWATNKVPHTVNVIPPIIRNEFLANLILPSVRVHQEGRSPKKVR